MYRLTVEEQTKILAQIKEGLNKQYNGKLIYLTVSGSDLYGFPSPDSDIDLRGCYLTGTENLLGLNNKNDVFQLQLTDHRLKPDIVIFELGKELNLAVKGNCNVLEHINSKPLWSTAEYLEMKQLVNNLFPKRGLYDSYKGMASFNYRKFIMQGKKTYKKYLYVFRGLMAGIYSLQTGRIEPSLVELNRYFKIPEVKELVEMKQRRAEESDADELKDSGALEGLISDLFSKLDDAYTRSKIPNSADEVLLAQLNEWVIKTRIKKIGN